MAYKSKNSKDIHLLKDHDRLLNINFGNINLFNKCCEVH